MVLEGGVVAGGDGLAVAEGGDTGGVAMVVGLDGDCGGLLHGVVDGEENGLSKGVRGAIAAGLTGDNFAASAARGTQDKYHYEDSR